MPKGGKRPGAGRKPGGRNKATIEREIARKLYEQAILKNLDPLIKAQFELAEGSFIMMARERESHKGKKTRTGRFVRVTNEKEILDL